MNFLCYYKLTDLCASAKLYSIQRLYILKINKIYISSDLDPYISDILDIVYLAKINTDS